MDCLRLAAVLKSGGAFENQLLLPPTAAGAGWRGWHGELNMRHSLRAVSPITSPAHAILG
ncbi:MAG: hypothetical protein H6668_01420 [Ardenticatenaceae bacterium]|nr:hypothetical protein [Ardenticatenaceae bacterium]